MKSAVNLQLNKILTMMMFLLLEVAKIFKLGNIFHPTTVIALVLYFKLQQWP